MSLKPLPVLIVEDDAALREALRDTLELSGYSVVEATDGSQALERIEQQRVGIVVTDVQMDDTGPVQVTATAPSTSVPDFQGSIVIREQVDAGTGAAMAACAPSVAVAAAVTTTAARTTPRRRLTGRRRRLTMASTTPLPPVVEGRPVRFRR